MKLQNVYACYNVDSSIRRNSSSGAVFPSLAKYVISKHGVVYGVAMSDDCYSAEFIAVTDSDGLIKLRGSKYLQAKVGDTFKRVKSDLLDGKLVLFTGTGCQVNGLKSFLGTEYNNLICVDVICHGTPSPALWRKYVQYQEQIIGGKVKAVNFRCKDRGWINFGMKKAIKVSQQNTEKMIYISKDEDPYMQMFLRNYCLRPSCYNCSAKKVKMADISIADFWGINKVAPEMNDGMGTSLVLVRTDKGNDIFRQIFKELKKKEVSYEDGVRENTAEYKSCSLPPQRDKFFDDMNNMGFEDLKKKYAARITFQTRAKRKVKSVINSVLRVIGGGRE